MYLAVGDVSGDNLPDIVVANYGSNNVAVLLNAGNGTFLPQVTHPTGTNSCAVAIADVNGDNLFDIFVTNHGSSSISILLNAGNGTFLTQISYSTGSSPHYVAVVDVNNTTSPTLSSPTLVQVLSVSCYMLET